MRGLIRCLMILSVLSASFCLNAQNQQVIDSLSKVVESNISEKIKVDALIKLSKEYYYSDTITFWNHINNAISKAERINYQEGKADAIYNIGRSYILRGKFDQAKEKYTESLELAQSINYQVGISNSTQGYGHLKMYFGEYDSAIYFYERGKAILENGDYENLLGLSYQNLARVYISKGEHSKAIEFYEKALTLLDEDEKYNSYMGLGTVLYYQGFYTRSMEYQFEALKLQEKAGFAKAIAGIHGNIANNYSGLGEYEKAKKHLEKAITIFEKNNDQDFLALAYNNLSGILRKLNENELARRYLKEAITIYESRSTTNEYLPICYRNLAEISMEYGEFQTALEQLNHALELSQEIDNEMQISNILLTIGRAQLKMKDYASSDRNLTKAIELAEKLNIIRNIQDGYRELAKLKTETGRYKDAYSAFEKFKIAEDSIKNEEKAKLITRMELEYEFEKEKESIQFAHEKEVLAYNQQLERRNWTVVGLVILAILISTIALLAFRSNKIKRTANQKLKRANDDLRDLNKYLEELRAREKELSQAAISAKERELASISMSSHEKNSLLKDLEQQLKFIEHRVDEELSPSFKQLKKTISNGYSMDDSWHSFLHSFQDVHPHFFDKLKNQNPQLSNDDLKLSAYLKIGMSNKEIANVTHLALGSVKTKVNRLKKKLNMTADDNLRDYMVRFA
jgi:tetratricopeptide (TPR) repeat protein